MFEAIEELSLQKNVFSSPWKKSDVVLVVQGTEFHVHRSILTSTGFMRQVAKPYTARKFQISRKVDML